MRKEKDLMNLFRGLVNLLGEEAERNPEFAAKLESLLSALPDRKAQARKAPKLKPPKDLPDIHAEWNTRGEAELRLWLRDQPVATLRALIRQHDFDAARRTAKWKDAEKLSDHIADQLHARMARGSSFMKSGDHK